MNGNVKVKINDKKAEKVINLVGFIESQMEMLADKLDGIDMLAEAEELEVMLETYSDFSERLIKELRGAIHENNR